MAVLYLPRVMLTKANFAFNETPIAFRAHVGDTVLFLCSFFLLFFSFTPFFVLFLLTQSRERKSPVYFFQTFFFILSTDPTSILSLLLYSKFSIFSILSYCKYIYGFMLFFSFFFKCFFYFVLFILFSFVFLIANNHTGRKQQTHL